MKIYPRPERAAFTLAEMMMSMACGSVVLAALLTAGVALQRSFAAVEGYSIAQGDQLRVQDYIAMDCRRATSVVIDNGSWVLSGGTWSWVSNVSGPVTLIISVPNYYDNNGAPVAPDSSVYSTTGAIQYGSATPTKISYYQSGNSFMRQIGSNSTQAKAIATNVSGFNVKPLSQSATNGTVSCSITFAPKFVYVAGANPIAGTTVYSNTFLRNAGARQ